MAEKSEVDDRAARPTCEYHFHGEDRDCGAPATHYVNAGVYDWRGYACRRHAVAVVERRLQGLKSGRLTAAYGSVKARWFALDADGRRSYDRLVEFGVERLDDRDRLNEDDLP